jgi:DNA processing protein
MMYAENLYKLGLTFLPEVGPVRARFLLEAVGNAEALFKEKKSALKKIPGIPALTLKEILKREVLQQAESEMRFSEKNGIDLIFFDDPEYPVRLKACNDAPLVLYVKGNVKSNVSRVMAVVGSRKATPYGKNICEKLVKGLSLYNATVVSGLAYGIDICAHMEAVKNNIPTIAVVAHGLDMIYPQKHEKFVSEILDTGGLISEFPSCTTLHPDFFPRRNRIIAGLSDATLVVEAGIRSGSLITAELANSYNREVFAVPGRLDDHWSSGCNYLLKTHKAALVQSEKDFEFLLGWELKSSGKSKPPLTGPEKQLENLFLESRTLHLDEISFRSGLDTGKVLSLLLQMEFSGHVASLPGKMYRWKG